MGKIAVLAEHEVQKIAAGEVVERPANVVKELLENALDAGATHLMLFIEEGGKKLIRLVDNGCGMSEEDAQLCILPHATSKIRTVNELAALTTFGFRGEALASISAVSEITLVTQEQNALTGTQLILHYGKLQHTRQISKNPGTDITINNLFENVPVRKKFLKTTETEWRAIVQLFQAFCLAYPEVHFALHHNNNTFYNCPPVKKIEERVTQLFGHSLESALLPLEASEYEGYKIQGVITQSFYQRYDRSQLFFFVNKRWIKNYKVAQALLKGYSQTLTAGKYPAAFIFITIQPDLIDINIHPRKEEVQFLYPRKVEMSIEQATRKRLEQAVSHLFKPAGDLHEEKKPQFSRPLMHEKSLSLEGFPSKNIHTIVENHFKPFEKKTFDSNQREKFVLEQPFTEKEEPVFKNSLIEPLLHDFRIIGQLHQTYIIIETEQGLVLIDQHAAHERILYGLFAQRFHEVAIITLLFPLSIKLSEPEFAQFLSYRALFEQHGFHHHLEKDQTVIITSIPAPLKDAQITELIHKTLLHLQHFSLLQNQEFFHHELRSQMACKAAIKAGDILTSEHMQELVKNFLATAHNSTCPHGRPTLWPLLKTEIEKKFQRI